MFSMKLDGEFSILEPDDFEIPITGEDEDEDLDEEDEDFEDFEDLDDEDDEPESNLL